jgi:hypothetical protein
MKKNFPTGGILVMELPGEMSPESPQAPLRRCLPVISLNKAAHQAGAGIWSG